MSESDTYRRVRSNSKRRGAAVLEMALVLSLFLGLSLGVLDLGVAVFRYHILANAARHGARRAIVHGEMSNVLGSWGPNPINNPATAKGIPIIGGKDGEIYIGMDRVLIGCDDAKTRIRVTWPNGSNRVGDPVRVIVTSPYQPIIVSALFPNAGFGEIMLSASSTMQIAH